MNSFDFITEKGGRGTGLVVNSLDIAAGIGGAAEQKPAIAVTEFGFEPLPATKSRAEPEACESGEELIFDLGAGGREVHDPGSREAVQGPEGRDGKKGGGFAGEVSASGGGREPDFVIEQYFALPRLRLNAEE